MVPKIHFGERFAADMDLPGESVPGMTVVELAGDRRVLIEKHGGVTQYSCEKIGVKVRYGQVEISGCGLELACMSREQLVITGRIDSICLLRRKRR